MLKILGAILVSPFTKVTYTRFFTAEVLTSFRYPLADIFTISCFYISGDWRQSDVGFCESLIVPYFAIAAVPYFIRLMQSLRRLYEFRQVLDLVNAGRFAINLFWALL